MTLGGVTMSSLSSKSRQLSTAYFFAWWWFTAARLSYHTSRTKNTIVWPWNPQRVELASNVMEDVWYDSNFQKDESAFFMLAMFQNPFCPLVVSLNRGIG